MSRSTKRNLKAPFHNLSSRLQVERLEDRSLPSCNTISGYVYYDMNNNGLFDPGETPIANSSIELRNANNIVVGSTFTDANGFYEFDHDATLSATNETLTRTVTFSETQTNFTLQGALEKFDPSLGELQSIEIRHSGAITSEIQVENYSNISASNISGTVAGNLTLTGPGLNNVLNISGYAGSFQASIFDGITDFAGTSGASLGQKTATGLNTITLTGAAMNSYIGAGTVTLTESGIATSSAAGGGNVDVRIRSTGQSTITVIYHYIKPPCLAPGNYKIIQTQQPPSYFDGRESRNGTVIPNTIGTDFINVSLTNVDLVNNNFGELKETTLSGNVWHDANNNGIRELNEDPIAGALLTLLGPGGTRTTTTDAAGYYEFTRLDPGTYSLREAQPAGFLDGKDNAGTKGGTVVNAGTLGALGIGDPTVDQIRDITLQAGDNSQNNDFGEIRPASIAGHVYYDANDNGVFEPGETPLAGVKVTLTGFNDLGPVSLTMNTNAAGAYKFSNLRPGTYALAETQPTSYLDGKDTIGTPGGITGNDLFSNINLVAGFDGVNNDFGEIKGDTPGAPLPKTVLPWGTLPVISKVQVTAIPVPTAIDPTLRAQMSFVVATHMTLTRVQLSAAQTLAAVKQLNAGMTQRAYVAKVMTSNAYYAAQAGNIYKAVFRRPPTVRERAQTVAALKAGASEMTIKENLFTSAAYLNRYPTPTALATALARDILNRIPGTVATQNLLQSMSNQPLNDVVRELLMSDDALANQIDNVYRLALRRAATPAEVQTWTAPIRSGAVTTEGLAQRLLASAEFYQLAFNKVR
ncbi:MAG: choice-of-anchor E domain-containing protein [Planctomycetes bacterium]|nr:choice-of-anchor E domain-containing protein [Planctomycetota bacterium]